LTPAGAADGLVVRLEREPAADLIPRFDGTSLRFTSKGLPARAGGRGARRRARAARPGEEGRLVGVTVLEERRFWQKGPIAWELPARATPHRLDVPEGPTSGPGGALASGAEVRWDAGRRLCGVLFGAAAAPEVLALGPRAFAAVDGDVLVGLLADLRGFDKA
jgi:hypothetical protein